MKEVMSMCMAFVQGKDKQLFENPGACDVLGAEVGMDSRRLSSCR
eukprot:CAMPEP_0177346834 /NCGR_PEP_ID=MMETSP0368-20130122/29402_1 /TAXON_ID=447022 ORGANISM="Scrippsiella hangoei-like, Strain SHHI-4" /NCGR_SAMPLE_ID=MMETSP0368 /ASSEMBLY_ACC=CAM_ASM_000363 /LENGTH=44 /DNA_ID= /DNA_START= /DNA_END= /DNA_ORIENTATION=